MRTCTVKDGGSDVIWERLGFDLRVDEFFVGNQIVNAEVYHENPFG